MATTPNLGLSQLTEDENFDIDTYNGDNLKVDTFAGTIPKEKTLYSNANGSSNTIALNDSAANYTKISIDWVDNDANRYYGWGCSNGSITRINSCVNNSNATVFRSAKIIVSGTSITFSDNKISWLTEAGYSSNPMPGEPAIKITKVVGLKGF